METLKQIYKYFILFFKILIFAEFTFKKPIKKDYLLFDDNLEFFFQKYIPKKNYSILFSRHKKYNFLLILNLLFKFRLSSLNYFNQYIKYVQPKILITFSDNYSIFYRLKVPTVTKKIFVQAANRTATSDDIFFKLKDLKKTKKYNNVDEMLVFNNKIGEKYKSFITGNTRIIGSIKSNAFKIKSKKKNFDLFYISTWRDHSPKYKFTKSISWQKLLNAEKKFLYNLKNYVIENKKHLTIYGKYNSLKEKKYFSEIFQDINWKYLKNNRMKSYFYCDQARLIISNASTLGYEALGRGSKVVFFNYNDFDSTTISKNFCWPYKLKKQGSFWTNDTSKKSCEKLINFVYKLNRQKWKKTYNKEFKDFKFIIYDKNNKTLQKVLKPH